MNTPRSHVRLFGLSALLVGLMVVVGRPLGTDAELFVASSNAGWTEVGSGSASNGGISNTYDAARSVIAVMPNGYPIVAWDSNYDIYVRHWNGSAWSELGIGSASGGGISNNVGNSFSPSIAVTPDGSPIVAWIDNSDGDSEIYIKQWNGTAWVELGGESASNGGISNNLGQSYYPHLIVTTDGTPIVSWQDSSSGNLEIYVRRWNGSAWIEMGDSSASGGGISNTIGTSENPQLAVDANGAHIITWDDNSNGYREIYVRRWNGTDWVELGTGSASGGGISNNLGLSMWPQIVIGSDGIPVVAWLDLISGPWQIYARRWNGADWIVIGTGSASGNGISNTGEAWALDLGIAADGNPIVVWEDYSNGNGEVYLRHWNGTAWEEMGSGSASGGGISNDSGDSRFPTIATAANGTVYVTWFDLIVRDDGSRKRNIFVRQFVASSTCYNLTSIAIGQGSDPTASPTNSPACSTGQYTAGQAISLTAAPATGWRVAGWSGTSNNDSTATTNNLSMPANDHAVSVTYDQIPPTCYVLSRIHTGQGSDPTASPTSSPGCSAGQYTAGQAISLSAAPAVGWRVAGWSGTSNDGSTAATNNLTMPAANHTTGVTYQLVPTTGFRAYVPSLLHQPAPPCFAGPNEEEPNNRQIEANGPLCSGRTVDGLPRDVYDMFYFDAIQPGNIAVDMAGHAYSRVQLLLYFQKASGDPVARDYDPQNDWKIRYQGPAGRYYVVVFADKPLPSSSIPYSLRATFPTSP